MRIDTLIVIGSTVVTTTDVVGDQLIVRQSSCVSVVVVKLILGIQVVVRERSRILVAECVIIIRKIHSIIVVVIPDVS